MITILVCLVAFAASALTLFSGFGLGTLLLPAFALFYPVELAVASTAVVHFLNTGFKLVLVGRYADRRVLVRFGTPAIAAAFLGAWALLRLADIPPIASYTVFGLEADVRPAKLVIGILLILVTLVELAPRVESVGFPPRYLPVGGLLSGFFGGLAGMQGALRAAFLVRAGLSKEAFIATSAALAALVDVSRLGVYSRTVMARRGELDGRLLSLAVLSAFLGAFLGSRFLPKLTMRTVQRLVGAMLAGVALGLVTGLL